MPCDDRRRRPNNRPTDGKRPRSRVNTGDFVYNSCGMCLCVDMKRGEGERRVQRCSHGCYTHVYAYSHTIHAQTSARAHARARASLIITIRESVRVCIGECIAYSIQRYIVVCRMLNVRLSAPACLSLRVIHHDVIMPNRRASITLYTCVQESVL